MERCCEIEGWVVSSLFIPGFALADIYEQYGARLLEQNVRLFLQFTQANAKTKHAGSECLFQCTVDQNEVAN